MREIKFRAWDKNRKTMTPSFDFRQWEGNKLYRPDNGISFFGDLIILQYTGLKDKNGVEIYEGDVVKLHETLLGIHSDIDRHETIGYIDYERGTYLICLELEKNKYGYKENYECWDDGEHDWYSLENEDFDTYEVIGNIYENPELIKE